LVVQKKNQKKGEKSPRTLEHLDSSLEISRPKVPLTPNGDETRDRLKSVSTDGRRSRSRTPEPILIQRLAQPTSYQYSPVHGFVLKVPGDQSPSNARTSPQPLEPPETEMTPRQKPERDDEDLHFNLVDFSGLESPSGNLSVEIRDETSV